MIAYGEDAKPRELVAYEVPVSKQVLVKQEVQDFMKESLPNYMLPTEVVLGIRTGCYATICDQRRVMDYESNPQESSCEF